VKFFIGISDFDEAVFKYGQLVSLLKPNHWFRFINGKVDEERWTHQIFLSVKFDSNEDIYHYLRKFVELVILF
jgi:hypothetical protein